MQLAPRSLTTHTILWLRFPVHESQLPHFHLVATSSAHQRSVAPTPAECLPVSVHPHVDHDQGFQAHTRGPDGHWACRWPSMCRICGVKNICSVCTPVASNRAVLARAFMQPILLETLEIEDIHDGTNPCNVCRNVCRFASSFLMYCPAEHVAAPCLPATCPRYCCWPPMPGRSCCKHHMRHCTILLFSSSHSYFSS